MSTLTLGCNQKQSQKQTQEQNKSDFIDKNNITSFKIHNIRAEQKKLKVNQIETR